MQQIPTTNDYSPARDFLMLRLEKVAETTEGGIIIPEQARRNLNEGEILKVGPDCSDDLKPGMFVVFAGSSDYQLQMENKEMIHVVQETNLLLTRQVKPSLFPA